MRSYRLGVLSAVVLTVLVVASPAPATSSPVASQRDCLADGSGALTVALSGEHDFDIEWDNAGTVCHGAGSQYGVGVNFSRTLEGNATLSFGLTIQQLAEGATGDGLPARVSIAGDAVGNDMFGTDCTVNVTEHTLVEEGPGTNKYKVSGTGECTAAAAGYSGGEITVGAFTFTGATDWPK